MKNSGESQDQSASELISKRIAELGDWRGKALSRMRRLIKEADPDVVEEWKWMGTPIWSHDGIRRARIQGARAPSGRAEQVWQVEIVEEGEVLIDGRSDFPPVHGTTGSTIRDGRAADPYTRCVAFT